jgi:hypothetical protein
MLSPNTTKPDAPFSRRRIEKAPPDYFLKIYGPQTRKTSIILLPASVFRRIIANLANPNARSFPLF